MNTTEINIRQQLILNKLRRGNFTFDEIAYYLTIESDIQGLDLTLSKRTLQRDINSISSVYNVEIIFDRSINKYRIENDDASELQQRLLETIDLYNALSVKEKLSDSLIFETRNPLGTQFIGAVLLAIKKQKQLKFEYHKYWKDSSEQRIVEPSALKEHKQRWYIVGNDVHLKQPRIFGLDRIKDLEVTKVDFILNKLNVHKMFENCFGIISPNNELPIEIELTFNSFQAKYIKSLPLHHSQQIIKEDNERVVFKLFLVPTFDFKMELLSFGSNLITIKPKSLKTEIIQELQKSLSILQKF